MFDVDFDAAAGRMTIRVRGFWALEDVPALAAAIGPKVQAARAIRDDFDVLVDSRDFAVQANDVADLLPAIMRGGMAVTRGRAAVVVGSHLGLMQAERTLAHPRVQVFLSLAEAETWLQEE